MLATHLTKLLKSVFELLERRNIDLENNDENIVSHVVGFLMNVFKNAESSIGDMQLSEAFRTSIVKDLRVICDDILKFIAHLNPETKLIDTQLDSEKYNLNKSFSGKLFTKDTITYDSMQLDDYYWYSGDFVSFKVVGESDTRRAFEEPLWSNRELEKIQHIVNGTVHSTTQNTSNHDGANKSKVTNVETSKKEKEKVQHVVDNTKRSKTQNTNNHTVASKGNITNVETSKKEKVKVQHVVDNTKRSKAQNTNNHTVASKGKITNVETSKKQKEKLQQVVNDTTQSTSNHAAVNKSKVSRVKTSKKENEKVVKTVKSLPNNSTAASSAPDTCSQNLTSTTSSISHNQSTHCTVNHISVRNINSPNDLNAKDGLRKTRYISVLHLYNLAVINASFAIDKMEFNSVIREGALYKCLLCSVHTEYATDESLNSHIQSSSHMDKLAEDIIWISSLGVCVKKVSIHLYKCCLCLTTDDIAGMQGHFNSIAHKQSSSSATALCSSTLEAMENAVENKEMNAEMLTSNFQTILDQHKIKILNNRVLCDTCSGTVIPMSLYNLYTHIAGQKHWPPYFLQIKKSFVTMPKTRNHVDETYRGYMKVYNSKDKSYCHICNVFVGGVSKKTMKAHIRSYAHNKFLMLFLKNIKFCAFVDLNEVSREEGGELSLPGPSNSKPKANASQKTEIVETKFLVDAGSHIIFDYDIAIEKPSWNGMIIFQANFPYFCVLCQEAVLVTECTEHIAKDFHENRLRERPVNSEHLTRQFQWKDDDFVFCLPCGTVQEEPRFPNHALSVLHKARVQQLRSACENWKVDMNRNYVKVIFPTFSEADHNTLVTILKQNKLLVLDRSYRVYCGLCSQHFYVNKLQEIYDHIARTGHFSAFVKSRNMNWAMVEPKYVNGVMTSPEDDKIAYCLVCNYVLPSASAADHHASSVHEFLLPIFIRNIFSDHRLEHTDGSVVCTMCERNPSDRCLNIFNICEHTKGSLHLKNYERILKAAFCDISPLNYEIPLNLGQAGIQSFHQFDISYCGTCNVLLKGVSDASVLGHVDSKIHYIFEHVGPKKLKKKK